ncbi:hypothetical protein HB991_12980 [Yersinia mollaretii]|uniref:Uncharacterized protein n=1 Tax=Yersinia mollaretii TaxID=33060 RepID=A0AA44CMP8_YERMO|nr:hypothetical protein [Yersinia mollaretii]NIL23420.1 hypothetical protein [Yersinia mollaretii]
MRVPVIRLLKDRFGGLFFRQLMDELCPLSGRYSFYDEFGLFWLKRFSHDSFSVSAQFAEEKAGPILAEL